MVTVHSVIVVIVILVASLVVSGVDKIQKDEKFCNNSQCCAQKNAMMNETEETLASAFWDRQVDAFSARR
jgi:hypothetical protein